MIDQLPTIAGEIEEKNRCDQLIGNDALVTAYPNNEDDVIRLLSWADANRFKVIVEGGGTKRGFGGIEERGDLVLNLSRLTGIIEHSPGDLTVKVRAGTTIAALQEKLNQANQMFPLDPYWPENATIGGVLAANDNGPKRLKYGSARDHVLGLRVVYPDGRLIRTGGQVVKNVAGYDLNKLFIGSMGTLGVITEATLKLHPLPKDEQLALITIPEQHYSLLVTFMEKLFGSPIQPASLELFNPPLHKQLGGKEGYCLAISFEDQHRAVAYQIDWLTHHLPLPFTADIVDQAQAVSWWQKVAYLPPNPAQGHLTVNQVVLKIGSSHRAVLSIMEKVDHLAKQIGIMVKAHAGLGHGLAQVYLADYGAPEEQFVFRLRHVVNQYNGYVVLRHAPLAFRQKMNVWGPPPSYQFLVERIKRKIDPHFTLNPKRFVGGL